MNFSRVWKDLEQHVLDSTSDQWQCQLTACVSETGGHLDHNMQKTAYLSHRLIAAVD